MAGSITYLVLVPIHSRQSANMCEDVLDGIGKLEGVDISEAILDMGVNNELGQTKDFSAQVERVSEARLFSLLCCQSPK